FRPGENITREQMVTMIVRALKTGGKPLQVSDASLNTFSDGAMIADWAKEAAAEVLTAGIVQGTSSTTFSAKQNATRAQSAVMLKRMLHYLQFIN
ncbi:S-layer homology domain-containing protein, partial [Paenibacillus sp. TAF58]